MDEAQRVLSGEQFDEVDFGNGIRMLEGILSVRWPGGVCLKLSYTWAYHLTIERDGSSFKHQIFRKEDNQILNYVKRWVKDICNGRYSRKKTDQEQIQEVIIHRNLTSYMNNTKWKKFRNAMLKEMSFQPPYDYKTLYDESEYSAEGYMQYLMKNEGPHSFSSFDVESFNFVDYKSLELVKVRPRFFSLEGGILVKKQIWHDSEKEFVEILKKYNIPYELENGVYTIYGYK